MKKEIKAADRRRKRPEVRFPDRETWKDLVRDLRLNASQANELGITIRHAILDLESHRARQAERPELVVRLKRLEKAFERLLSEVNGSAHLMGKFLPRQMLEHIGISSTFAAMREALGKDVSPEDADGVIRQMVSRGDKITMLQLETRYAPERQALGLQHGHKILKHYINSLWAPLKNWVEADKLNKGGRPSEVARNYLIDQLAEEALELIGRPASISTSGKFVEFCAKVLPACGLSAKGIEKAVASVVRQKRARERR
jgi:hypothetical protein